MTGSHYSVWRNTLYCLYMAMTATIVAIPSANVCASANS